MSEPLRVLHIITRLDPGGSSTNTIETVARLNPDRYCCTLVAGKTSHPELQTLLNERHLKCTFVDELRRNLHPWFDVAAFVKLLVLIRRGRYHIVHTHTSKAGILGRWAARLAGVPCIVHTPHGHVFYGYFNRLVSYFFLLVERWTALITDRLITLTERGRQEHVDCRVAPPDRFAVIPSGIDLQKFSHEMPSSGLTREASGLRGEQFVFGCVARLEPVKGQLYLIQAFAEIVNDCPSAALLLVGDGAQRRELEALCRRLGVQDRVCFTGYQKDVGDYIQLIDCFVLPSLNEGMGRSILEAMALGKPVIATRTGGIPELVNDGVNGYLVNTHDIESLATAMRTMLMNPAQAMQFGQAGRGMISSRFNVETMVESIDHLYREVLSAKNRL